MTESDDWKVEGFKADLLVDFLSLVAEDTTLNTKVLFLTLTKKKKKKGQHQVGFLFIVKTLKHNISPNTGNSGVV